MFADVLKQYMELAAGFADDMFDADIANAKAEIAAAQAGLVRLQKRKAAVTRLIAKFRALEAKSEADAKKRQDAWNKKMRKDAKKAAARFGAPVITAPYPAERRAG